MTFHEKTSHAARGKWKGILLQLGVPAASLTGKHAPCPMCGGEDRFRFDNKDQRGTFICNACGAGDGMKLAIGYTGRPFTEIAAQIDAMLGNVTPDSPSRPAMSDDDRRKALRAVYADTKPMQPGDLAHRYLQTRGIEELVYPKALRFASALRDGDGGIRPAMVAIVTGADDVPVTLHRTFLKPDGSGKAEMKDPRKVMPGELPDGVAVRLCEYHGGPLGIAEGIETAMSASALYEMPVWAALNAGILAKWIPPAGCEEVAVFGDNDENFHGQAAAYSLAHRLAVKKIHVTVHIPEMPGLDFNDIWQRRRKK